MNTKLALAMIVKGSDIEADLLDRCLSNVGEYLDGIFITITHKPGERPNQKVFDTCVKHKAYVSYFSWCNDFAKARNFSFSQVSRDFGYIMWLDADDMVRGIEKLRATLESNQGVDAFAFWYLYAFDEYKQATVVHKKTQIVRNDGCVEWVGALHEDFKENRSLEVKFVEGIERMHLTTDERVEIAKTRNVEVARKDNESNPNDPRTFWNLGNSYVGNGQYTEARDTFKTFIKLSGSEEEKYLAVLRLAEIESTLGNRDDATDYMYKAIGMRPDYPDGYIQTGYFFFNQNNIEKAEFYLLNGIVKKPPYHKMIVYNPRDYDYNPMMLLAKVYFSKNRPDLALPLLEGCLKIHPGNEYIASMVREMKAETERMNHVIEEIKEIEKIDDLAEKKKRIEAVPEDLQSHPALCALRNQLFIKTESSGKDLVYYCGLTQHEWNPEMAKTKGVGGSEEAVMNLAREWAKKGWNVMVYNNCGHKQMIERTGEVYTDEHGVVRPVEVTYKPFWEFNYRDKQDVVILWRSPKACDHDINSDKIFVDLHDVIPSGEFTEKRLAKIHKVMVKTNAHRVLFPNVPDEKIEIVPNGMDFDLFNQDVKKDQYMLVNTSSPDRSMDVMPKLFKNIKEQVPQVRMKWAYGFDIFNQTFADDVQKCKWRDNLIEEMKQASIEMVGRLSQKECAKLYLEGNILAYPSEFYEIDCISVKKAQACGCMPITTDFAAFEESVQHGVKIHSPKNKENWCKDFQFSFGIESEEVQNAWVAAVVKELKKPMKDRKAMKEWSKKFDWNIIGNKWSELF